MQGRKGHAVGGKEGYRAEHGWEGEERSQEKKRRDRKEQDRCSGVKGFFCARRLAKCPMPVHIRNIWDFPGGEW